MSDLGHALNDYTTTICNLLDEEFIPLSKKSKKINLDDSVEIEAVKEVDFAINSIPESIISNKPNNLNIQLNWSDNIDQSTPKLTKISTPIITNPNKKTSKTINPLKLMGGISIVFIFTYGILTFLF